MRQRIVEMLFLCMTMGGCAVGARNDPGGWGTRGDRIVGGHNATRGAYPWMISVQAGGQHVCGASLIASEWALTAAHCVQGGAVALSVGAYRLSEAPEAIPVTRMLVHAEYRDFDNDIALLQLERPSDSPTLAPLEASEESDLAAAGVMATVIGWGVLAESGPSPDALQEVQVPVVSPSACRSAYPNITENQWCAGYDEGGRDACQGDSGGPIVVADGNGGLAQAGVVSFGSGCAQPGQYGVYTRVANYTDWIRACVEGDGACAAREVPVDGGSAGGGGDGGDGSDGSGGGGDCHGAVEEGSCDGDVLVYCDQGRLVAQDCTELGLVCGQKSQGGYYSCVDSRGAGGRCRSDADCPSGESCEADGQCYPGDSGQGGCQSDSDCVPGTFCEADGQCRGDGAGSGGCRSDNDCYPGEFCDVDGWCYQDGSDGSGCRSDNDCYPGDFCDLDGYCYPR